MGVAFSSPPRIRKTAVKLIRVLEQVAASPTGVDARSIAGSLNISISAAYDLLNTLEEFGYVRKLGYRYVLGHSVFLMWHRFLRQRGIVQLIRPELVRLAQNIHADVYVASYFDNEVVIIDVVRKSTEHMPKFPIGAAIPGHALAVGKVILAHLPRINLEKYLETHQLNRYTPSTITERRALMIELTNVRLTGVAFDRQEYSESMACVAAPVCDGVGFVLAAIGVAVSPSRLSDEERSIVAAIKDAAKSITWSLCEIATGSAPFQQRNLAEFIEEFACRVSMVS